MFCVIMDWPETETTGWCCDGSAYRGAAGCLCWEAVFDLPQVTPVPDVVKGRSQMCGDCAFRPGSPERSGDPGAGATGEDLDDLVATGQPFYCHAGMRRPERWVHPSGATIEGSALDYRPPIVDGVPYKVDGTPGDLCAGWTARSLKQAQRRLTGG